MDRFECPSKPLTAGKLQPCLAAPQQDGSDGLMIQPADMFGVSRPRIHTQLHRLAFGADLLAHSTTVLFAAKFHQRSASHKLSGTISPRLGKLSS